MNQLDMFGVATPEASAPPTPASIRQRLDALLEMLRASQELPWPPSEARSWKVVIPQMSNWLPQKEREAILAEFASQLERLQIKARA